jgi:hypothetical protein
MQNENRQMSRTYLYMETIAFVDGIRNTGIIDSKDMKKYMEKISSIGNLYQIEITHKGMIQDEEKNKFPVVYYNDAIFETLENEGQYRTAYNDFLKIEILDREKQMVVCYGGSIKADYSEEEIE